MKDFLDQLLNDVTYLVYRHILDTKPSSYSDWDSANHKRNSFKICKKKISKRKRKRNKTNSKNSKSVNISLFTKKKNCKIKKTNS